MAADWTPADAMVLSIADLLRDGETVFHGVASPLPLVAILAARRLHAPNLVYLSIAGGVNAEPQRLVRHSTADPRLARGADSLLPLTEIFDLSARGALDVAFLSGVQIDGRGNLNMSVVGDFHRPKVRLPGGAGSAALLPTVKRAILWKSRHDRRGLVAKLDFVTACGNVDKLVTPLGVFTCKQGRLALWRLFPQATLDRVREVTGFEVVLADDFQPTSPPRRHELKLLDEIDPERVRLAEF